MGWEEHLGLKQHWLGHVHPTFSQCHSRLMFSFLPKLKSMTLLQGISEILSNFRVCFGHGTQGFPH